MNDLIDIVQSSSGETLVCLLIVQIRVMMEEGLNCLPSYKCTVVTPTGESYVHDLVNACNTTGCALL